MGNENGTWIMYGVEWDDPECLHTVQDAIDYINEVGFLPLFKNDIPGFSLEERTAVEYWWCGNPKVDPWEWRELIARSGEVAYGKFFEKKAGFISKEWLPYFVNYRRDGYDFDALWDDEKASRRQKKIMDCFEIEDELYSNDLKQKAGFAKGGEKGFDGTITDLQMKTYLCVKDFRQRKNKKSELYGWPIAVYAKPEALWGYEYVTSRYSETPEVSGKAIAQHIMELYPVANADQIKRLIGGAFGTEVKTKKKKTDYPQNLFKALGLEKEPTDDQIMGLEYAIPMIKEREQEVIRYRFQEGLTYKEIGEKLGVSDGRAGQVCNLAIRRLKRDLSFQWIKDGYEATVKNHKKAVVGLSVAFETLGKYEQSKRVYDDLGSIKGLSSDNIKCLLNMGIDNVGLLVLLARQKRWEWQVFGIGDYAATHIEKLLYDEGLDVDIQDRSHFV